MQHPVEAYLFNNITSPLFALILARSHKKRLNLGGDRVETGSSRNGGDAGGFHAGGRVYRVDRTPRGCTGGTLSRQDNPRFRAFEQ